MLARAKFEERLKEKRDRTFKDDLISYAPLIGGVLGAGLGGVYGGRAMVRQMDDAKKSFRSMNDAARTARSGGIKPEDFEVGGVFSNFKKESALLSNVTLHEHQRRALDKLDENGGSLLAAHATGSGKTLTGIAAFEKLKKDGRANKAIVVVPASLRENFIDNGVKRFTNSSVAMYGPKGEKKSLDVEHKSDADYNVISYELFREHGEKIIQNTGADTLIMDEIHRVRGDEGATYHKLRDLRPQFKQAITLTGSVVNNEPSDAVPLMDITFGPTGHKFVNRSFFDKLFVNKEAKTEGFLFNKKVYIEKNLKNKDALARYLGKKIDFVSHEELEKSMPKKVVEEVNVKMTPEQERLYQFSLSSVDPITRWKIRNNIPVGQREAMDAFSKLTQARQIATDPGVLDKNLAQKNPLEYSPKVQAVVKDLEQHLGEDATHRSVIYGNLIHGQLDAMEKALKHKGIQYSKFFGTGQEGVTAKNRVEGLKEFMDPKHPTRVLLLSGAGAEGLDLKNVTMMQMLEGHYNPEKIQQAEARIRRIGSFADKPEEERKVLIKRYNSIPNPTVMSKAYAAMGVSGGDQGIDRWIYGIAKRKDSLNEQFREVAHKANTLEKVASPITGASFSNKMFLSSTAGRIGNAIGTFPGGLIAGRIEKGTDAEIEAYLKQKLLDKGYESLTQKKHYAKILAESKVDEKIEDAKGGVGAVAAGLSLLSTLNPDFQPIRSGIEKLMPKPNYSDLSWKGIARAAAPYAAAGFVEGISVPIIQALAKERIIKSSIGGDKDLDVGINRYLEKLRKKHDAKYKGSKSFVNEYETKKELGIDTIL